jgi:nitrogen fixation NifU-like protein
MMVLSRPDERTLAGTNKSIFLSLLVSIRFKQKAKGREGYLPSDSGGYSTPLTRSILPPMFNDALLEHFRNPHNAGDLPDATATVEVTNPVCGDVLRLAVRVDNGRIAAARFKTQGCVAAIAASSVLTDLLTGTTPAEARRITPEQISAALGGLPLATFHAAQLCADAIAAIVLKL